MFGGVAVALSQNKKWKKERKMYRGFYALKLLKHYFKFNDILKIEFSIRNEF